MHPYKFIHIESKYALVTIATSTGLLKDQTITGLKDVKHSKYISLDTSNPFSYEHLDYKV